MKKNKNKSGFNLAELIVVLTIISFIIIYEMIIVTKKTNEYSAAYYDAYNSLRKVVYNVFSDDYCPDPNRAPSPDDPTPTPNGYNCALGPRVFPKDAKELCKRLSEYFNIPGDAPNCEAQSISEKADNFIDEGENATLMFRTSNSYKFYISQAETPHTDKEKGDDDIEVNHSYIYKAHDATNGNELKDVEYFIVYIDINGDKKPNSVNIKESFSYVYPDIVPFAVTRRGEVIPMGYPLYSTNYITARVRYPDIVDDNNGNITEDISESMSLNNAIRVAWREGDDDFDIPFTYRLTQAARDKENEATTFFMKDNHDLEEKYVSDIIDINQKPYNIKGCAKQSTLCTINIEKSGYVRN